MFYSHLIAAALLLSWFIFWVFFFCGKKSSSEVTRTSHLFFLLTYAVFVSIGALHYVVFSTAMYSSSLVHILAGFIILWSGQGLMLWARYSLGFLSNRQVLFEIASRQVSGGPYRYLHHPMYLGLLTALAATCFIFNSLWGFAFLLLCVLPLFIVRAYIETRPAETYTRKGRL